MRCPISRLLRGSGQVGLGTVANRLSLFECSCRVDEWLARLGCRALTCCKYFIHATRCPFFINRIKATSLAWERSVLRTNILVVWLVFFEPVLGDFVLVGSFDE